MSADPRLARARPSSAAASSSQTSRSLRVPSRQAASSISNSRDASNSQAPRVNGVEQEDPFKLRFCTVCASNNNRSMEGHLRLAGAKYPVISFGTGSLVRLPGPSANQPNVYEFNSTSYNEMHQQLQEKDPSLYRSNGILTILERNRSIKRGPERWQLWNVGEPRTKQTEDLGFKGSEGGVADIVITCEERCWDAVVEDLLNRGSPLNRPVHIINMDIKDSHEEGLVGGKAIVDLADSLNRAAIEEREIHGEEGWAQGNGPSRAGFDERVPDILADWQERWEQFPALWTVAWF